MELERWVCLRFCYVLDLYFLVSFFRGIFSPHLCVGFLFLVVHFRLSTPPLTHTSHSHTTCHNTTYSHTQLVTTQLTHTHNLLTHTTSHNSWHLATSTVTLRGRRGTWRHGPPHVHFAWQAWHLVTCTCTLRGRRGTYGTRLALVARVGPR